MRLDIAAALLKLRNDGPKLSRALMTGAPTRLEGERPTMDRHDWDDQFAETAEETAERWRATMAKRKAEGKCWQCAKMIAECTCPNVKHTVVTPARSE